MTKASTSGNDCFSIFIAILGLAIFLGGWINGAGFWFSGSV